MAKTREIVKRRNSVKNIWKITRTMEMISTSRYRKAYKRIMDARPYNEQLIHLLTSLTTSAEKVDHPLLRENVHAQRAVVLILTSNRGLCGGFNGNVLRLAMKHVDALAQKGHQVEVWISGKKGINALRFNGRSIARSFTEFDDKLTYRAVEPLADELIRLQVAGEAFSVDVVYTRFLTAATHRPEVVRLLPGGDFTQYHFERRRSTRSSRPDYLVSPPPAELLAELIPVVVRAEVFECFLDALASEQVARMRAMKAATDNADQMIEILTRQYNRVRQSQITNELLDILGGSEALATSGS